MNRTHFLADLPHASIRSHETHPKARIRLQSSSNLVLLLALSFCAAVLLPGSARAQIPAPNGPGSAVILNDGFYHYVRIPDGVWFSGDFTIEAWVHVRSYNSWSRLLDFGNVDPVSGEG